MLSYYWVLIGGHICRVDWHNNEWPWVTSDGRFINIYLVRIEWKSSQNNDTIDRIKR